MSKFTRINRGEWPPIEVYEGDTFLTVGLVCIGGALTIHLTPEQADELADTLRTISRKQLQNKEVEA